MKASVAFGPYGRRTLFATTGGLSPQPLGRWPHGKSKRVLLAALNSKQNENEEKQ